MAPVSYTHLKWTGRARLIRRQLFGIPNMAMWLVSLNRKKKGHDNHAPERVEKVRFIPGSYTHLASKSTKP